MAKVTMTLEGMDALKRTIAQIPSETSRLSSTAIRASAGAVADRMRQLAPRGEGNLIAAIQTRGSGVTAGVEIGAQAPYWRFLEYGTKYMAARPFVRTATESEAPAFEGRFGQVGRDLEHFWGRQK